MKKLILFALIIIGFQTAKSQISLQQRYLNANKDSIRTQIRMAVLDYAEMQADTATDKNGTWANKRLCETVLGNPTASFWVDWFAYQYSVKENDAVPTDNKVKLLVIAVWKRVTILSTRR